MYVNSVNFQTEQEKRMDYTYLEEGVKERLILSGLAELEEQGFRNFSLRRVATAAQVSCAAPYRHFKSKDELILAVIRYVREGWMLLCEQIRSAFVGSSAALITEICTAGVRFWLGNGSFRSVLFGGMGDTDTLRRAEMLRFDEPIHEAVAVYAKEISLGKESWELLDYTVLSLFWGSVMLAALGGGEAEDTIANMIRRLGEELQG